jgi:D-threonine aldolase
MPISDQNWFRVANVAEVSSPALLVYPARIRENIRRVQHICPDASRLRPHLKTHKMAEVLRLQLDAGINQVKCATPAEAELAAQNGVPDVLLAYPVVGPNIDRMLRLRKAFPRTTFSLVADDAGAVKNLSAACTSAGANFPVLLDVDCGMGRTGIDPSTPEAMELYRMLAASPGITAGGLHAYDGHIHVANPDERRHQWESAMAPVRKLHGDLHASGLPVPRFVAGGTPTFPFHAGTPDVECSPGTPLLWDSGYGGKYPDLDFLPAAVVVTRVISRPGLNRLCLDLGYKAIASENPHPRVQLLDLPDAAAVTHSEEHLVIETPSATNFPVGTVLYGVPRHVCPTVALYDEAVVIENGRATGAWKVAARGRSIHC